LRLLIFGQCWPMDNLMFTEELSRGKGKKKMVNTTEKRRFRGKVLVIIRVEDLNFRMTATFSPGL